MKWTDEARAVPFLAVAAELGAVTARRRVACPSCGQSRASSQDRRGPFRVGPDYFWLACCGEGRRHDALSLVALFTTGEVRPQDWSTVRAWYAVRGWCSPARDWTGHVEQRQIPDVPELDPSLSRHPPEEVADLWRRSVPVTEHPGATVFLRGRASRVEGLDAGAVVKSTAEHQLARALPVGSACPSWARLGGRTWADAWPLLLPCWDGAGRLAGLRARRVLPPGEDDPMGSVKEAAARSMDRDGITMGSDVATVYACAIGRRVLRFGAEPGSAPDPKRADLRWDGYVLVVEGGPAHIFTACDQTLTRPDGTRPAILGVWSGAVPSDRFGSELFVRFRSARRMVLAEDPDQGGARIGDAVERAARSVNIPFHRVQLDEESGTHGK